MSKDQLPASEKPVIAHRDQLDVATALQMACVDIPPEFAAVVDREFWNLLNAAPQECPTSDERTGSAVAGQARPAVAAQVHPADKASEAINGEAGIWKKEPEVQMAYFFQAMYRCGESAGLLVSHPNATEEMRESNDRLTEKYRANAQEAVRRLLARSATPAFWPDPEDWNLTCPKCGSTPDGLCGWPTNCPTGLNNRKAGTDRPGVPK
jgi:hypothetical protein